MNEMNLAFFSGFFRGGGVKSIVMQISIVMLLFSDQISGRGKTFQGSKLPQGAPPLPPPVEESQNEVIHSIRDVSFFLCVCVWGGDVIFLQR